MSYLQPTEPQITIDRPAAIFKLKGKKPLGLSGEKSLNKMLGHHEQPEQL